MSFVKGRGAVSGNKIQDDSKATRVSVAEIANRIQFVTNSVAQGFINDDGDIVFGTAGTSGVPGIEMVRADAGTDFGLKLKNTSNGDVRIGLALAAQSFSIGLDNSDGDKLKISTDEDDVGNGALVTLTPAGNFGIGTEDPQELLDVNGNVAITGGIIQTPTVVSSTPFTLDDTHGIVYVDATSAAVTINLPTAVGISGREYMITKIDSSPNGVTIDGNGTETINGRLTNEFNNQYDFVKVRSDGANWVVQATNNITEATICLDDGTAGAPSYSFCEDTDTGIFRQGTDSIALSAGGVEKACFNTSEVQTTVPVLVPDGLAGAPTFSFANDTDVGMYTASGDLLFSTTGTERLKIGTGGNITATHAAETTDALTILAEHTTYSGNMIALDANRDSTLLFNFMQFTNDVDGTPTEVFRVAGNGMLSLRDGSATTPILTFLSDSNTGLYSSGADELSISIAGVQTARIDANKIQVTDAGSFAVPGFSFIGDEDSGLYHPAADQLGVSLAGSSRAIFKTTGLELNVAGTASIPAINWASDPDTGIYWSATDELAIAAGGAQIARFNTGHVTVEQQLRVQDGSASTPSLTFELDTDTGFYHWGAGVVAFTSNGTRKLRFTSSEVFADVRILSIDGTNASPTYSFENDNDSGMFSSAANELGFSVSGNTSITLDSNGLTALTTTASSFGLNPERCAYAIRTPTDASATWLMVHENDDLTFRSGIQSLNNGGDLRIYSGSVSNYLRLSDSVRFSLAGSAATPSYSWVGDTDTGMYNTTNQINFSTGGVDRVNIDANGLTLATGMVVRLRDGSAASPSLQFTGDSDTGLYREGADEVCLAAGGQKIMCADSNGITVEGTITAEGIVGPSYSETSTSGGDTSIVDTGITVAEGEAYEVIVVGNPDAVENANFRDMIRLQIYITCGTDGTVKKYINVVQDFRRTDTLHSSGGGPLDADAVMLNATTEYTEVAQATSTTLRIKVSGYTTTVGANQEVRVKRLI